MSGTLTVWLLNGARFVAKTPNEEAHALKWLKGLSAPDTEVPDVLCLVDFPDPLQKYLGRFPHRHFEPMTNHKIWGERKHVGICIASRYPLDTIQMCWTWGDGIVRDLEGVGDDNQRIKPDAVADELVLKTENRVAIAASVMTPSDGPWRVITHHGFWTRGGETTGQQIQSTLRLCHFLGRQADDHNGAIYAADCNFDANGMVWGLYKSKTQAHDCLPDEITTTLAPDHPAAKIGVRPDELMIIPNAGYVETYRAVMVTANNEPRSDHLLICGEFKKV